MFEEEKVLEVPALNKKWLFFFIIFSIGAQKKPLVQRGIVNEHRAIVYESQDFDSKQVIRLPRNKIIVLSTKIYRPQNLFGSFYKVYLNKPQKIRGYISEIDVIPQYKRTPDGVSVNEAYKERESILKQVKKETQSFSPKPTQASKNPSTNPSSTDQNSNQETVSPPVQSSPPVQKQKTPPSEPSSPPTQKQKSSSHSSKNFFAHSKSAKTGLNSEKMFFTRSHFATDLNSIEKSFLNNKSLQQAKNSVDFSNITHSFFTAKNRCVMLLRTFKFVFVFKKVFFNRSYFTQVFFHSFFVVQKEGEKRDVRQENTKPYKV